MTRGTKISNLKLMIFKFEILGYWFRTSRTQGSELWAVGQSGFRFPIHYRNWGFQVFGLRFWLSQWYCAVVIVVPMIPKTVVTPNHNKTKKNQYFFDQGSEFMILDSKLQAFNWEVFKIAVWIIILLRWVLRWRFPWFWILSRDGDRGCQIEVCQAGHGLLTDAIFAPSKSEHPQIGLRRGSWI